MAGNSDSASVAARLQAEILEWVREQEPWKQDLFLRASATPELSPDDAAAVAEFLLGESKEGAGPREVTPDLLPVGEGSTEPMVIERIHELENVNKLDDGQSLCFAPDGVNAIWGANGAGKTGYSRILKHAGRTRDDETVLGNVAARDRGGPKATLRVRVGKESSDHRLDLTEPASPLLGRICVSDAKAAEIYLTEETEVDYIPVVLSNLSRLVDGLGAVKRVLQDRLDALDLTPIDPGPFGDTDIGKLIAGLDANTPEALVTAAVTFDEKARKRHSELRRRVAEIDAQRAPELRRSAEEDVTAAASLATDLSALAAALNEEALAAARECFAAVTTAKEAMRLAAETFAGEPFENIGTDPWRLLWQAALDFAHGQGQSLPPDHDPAHCPLCMQTLGPEAVVRLRSFERFVADDVSHRLEEAEKAVADIARRLPDAAAIELRHTAITEKLGKEEGELGRAVVDWLALARSSLEKLKAGEVDELSTVEAVPDLDAWTAARREEAAAQKKIESGEENETLRRELAELDARLFFAGRRDEVLAHLAALREAKDLGEAKAQTAAHTVSSKIKSLSEALVKKGLEEALERQLKALNFDGLEVVPRNRTVKGQPMTSLVFKTVDDVPLTDVLSAGEQRRLGLAMFLAEMEVLEDTSPIVLDDPTSSIDQEGRRHIARTVTALGRKRQVIVFTHEFSFIHELRLRVPKEVQLTLQHVCRMGKTVGHVRPHLPWDGLSPAERVPALRQMLAELRRAEGEGNPTEVAREAMALCLYLRESCERTVEDRILAGTVTRRGDEVHTKMLDRLIVDPEIAELVDEIMSEASEWLHARPAADGSLPFTSAELEEEINRYAELQRRITAIEGDRKDKARSARKQKVKTEKARETGRAPALDEREQEAPTLKIVPDHGVAEGGPS
jgi:ABC-type transport system involved in cytochrome c biogenesis ATPase subunit